MTTQSAKIAQAQMANQCQNPKDKSEGKACTSSNDK
jgi:hypothetical protein